MSTDQVSGRIKAVRKALKLSRPKIAKVVGCSPMSWKAYENGVSWPGGKILSSLSELGISIDWLLSGRGKMWIGRFRIRFHEDAGPDDPVMEFIDTTYKDVEAPPQESEDCGDFTNFLPIIQNDTLDEDLYGRITEGVSRTYKDEGARISDRDLGRVAARFAADLQAAYDTAEDRLVGLKAQLEGLRRDLRTPPATGEASTKRRA